MDNAEAEHLATSRGFTYWPGGESAPADWDGGEVLFNDGVEQSFVARWLHWQTPYARNIIGYRKRTEQPAPTVAPELVERMVALMAYMATGAESILEQCHPVNTGLGMAYTEAKAINDALRPEDPDLTLAKSILGDAEAIALAIKAARENAK